MKNENVAFAEKLLEKLKIQSHILKPPYEWKTEYDLQLRENIWQNSETAMIKFSEWIERVSNDSIIFTSSDSFCCTNIFVNMPEQDEILMFGPFTYEKITNNRILQLQKSNEIPDTLMNYMQLYYSALPYVSDERWIKGIVLIVAENLWKDNEITVKHYHMENVKDIFFFDDIADTSSSARKDIENRYKYEINLMECISDGNPQKLTKFSDTTEFTPLKQRFSDTIRDSKNSAIILNTLCRKAAQAGAVHPIYLDELSRKYAILIEESTSLSQIAKLTSEMPRKYCLLVKSHSLKNYSKPVQDVLNMISLDITDDLSLSTIADSLGINSSYLSNLFKKETGVTLTSYVNGKRIERSIFLLNTTAEAIQEIASACGIDDVNYFTKLFKKKMNMTPSEYRCMIHKKSE